MMEATLSERVCPEQTGLLLPAEGAGAGGFTITFVVLTVLVHPAADVVVTE